MITQPIYINAYSRIKFEWSHLYDAFYPNDSARVEVKFDTSSTWTEIWGKGQSRFESNDGAGTTVPGTFVSESINLDSATYMNKNIMVRIVGISGYGPHFFIDNVIVEEIPSCPEPTLLSHHALFSDSVALNWVNGLADNMWQIQYGSNAKKALANNKATITASLRASIVRNPRNNSSLSSLWCNRIIFLPPLVNQKVRSK